MDKRSGWKESRVFITGVDGFVGSHLAKRFLSLGASVGGVLHKPVQEGESGLLVWGIADRVKTYIGDIANERFVEYALNDFNPHWIFHLAAQSIVTKAQRSPFLTYETNIKGTYSLLCSASILKELQGIILASSDKAYGESSELPYTEKTPLRGGSIYDTSKACGDLIASSAAKSFDLQLCITRCANIYGPGDLHFSRIVPDTVKAVVKGEHPVIRGSGLHERDFIYVDDAIAAYVFLAEYMQKNKVRGEGFNIGNEKSFRIADLVQMILDIGDSEGKKVIILGKETPAEITKQSMDATKARTYLGWNPQVPLAEGLKRTIDWYRGYFARKEKNGTLYQPGPASMETVRHTGP